MPKPRSHVDGLLQSARQLLANPLFSTSKGSSRDDNVQPQFRVSPMSKAKFEWLQHFIHNLTTRRTGHAVRLADFVVANWSLSSNQSGEAGINRHPSLRVNN